MEMSVSSEMTFFTTKQQSEICPHLRTGSSAEDRGRIDTRLGLLNYLSVPIHLFTCYPFTSVFYYDSLTLLLILSLFADCLLLVIELLLLSLDIRIKGGRPPSLVLQS